MSATAILQNETFQNLLSELNIPGYEPSANVLALVAAESRFIKDLKINTSNVLNNNQHLTRKEARCPAISRRPQETGSDRSRSRLCSAED